MPSRRSMASRAPRLPLARQASASFTIRSLAAALNTRRGRFATVSRLAPLAMSASSGELSRLEIRVGLGTIRDPFSAHRYLRFQERLSQTTLAFGAAFAALRAIRTIQPECRLARLARSDERAR